MQFIFRFIVAGIIVSLCAGLGGVLKPKSFAGRFGDLAQHLASRF